MLKMEIRDAMFPNCPIRNVLSRVGDKWSMLILFTLRTNGVLRFNELKLNIPDISQKMLSGTLKVLEADGLITRKVYPEVPPRVEYSLTERANTLIPLIESLVQWSLNNLEDIITDRRKYLVGD
ncbi:MAG: helix-turn-helix domain-containing protein [Prevotellaceae bacterium]|nr:helix-turn-helix domain-containing protein [Prevotellaceae bacterium]